MCVCFVCVSIVAIILTSSPAANYCTTRGAAGKGPLNSHPVFTPFGEGGREGEGERSKE